jgi:hypothetical protein
MSSRAPLAALLALVALGSGVSPAHAQRQSCDFENYGPGQYFNAGTPQEVGFFGGGVLLRCDGGTTIRADSAVRTVLNNRLEFIRNVRYADSTRTLTSDYLQYLGQDRLIVATGNVRLTDASGTTLIGPFLSYYLKTDTRPDEVLQMPQGRPRAILVSDAAPDSAGAVVAEGAVAKDTTIVDANMIEIVGNDRFVGRGQVEMTRGELRTFSNQLLYQEQSGLLTLSGAARAETEEYALQADTLVAQSAAGTTSFNEIEGRSDARLDSPDMDVTGIRVRLYLADGEVERLVAVGDTAGGPEPAVALSPDFRLQADSIDALAPEQSLETVFAIGRAYGVRLMADSVEAEAPELIRNDWVRGDTIIARFTDPPPDQARADRAEAPSRVLEQLDAVGTASSLASSLYRMPDRRGADGSYAVNYLNARRITVHLLNGEVSSVEAEDAVHGLYLRPPEAQRRDAGRNAGTDRR